MQSYFSLLPLDQHANKLELGLALWFVEEIFKDFPHRSRCRNVFRYCNPHGTINEIKLILHYIRKHSCKSELWWYCGLWEESIEFTLPYFCTFVIIPPLKKTWTIIWINLNSHHADMFVPSLIEIGQMFHFERFFQIYKCKNSFPSCAPPTWPSGTIVQT